MLQPEIKFQTKPQLAAEILLDIAKQKQLPFRYVLADSVYTNPDFIEAVESLVGVTYLLQVAEDTLCWLQKPVVVDKIYKYQGQKRTKKSYQAKLKIIFQ